MRKNPIDCLMGFFLSLFLDGRKRKASGKTRNTTAGKGDRQIFTDITAISDCVTSNYELMAADYIITNGVVY